MGKISEVSIGENANYREMENPISDYKLENCYVPNGKIYPLCKGQDGNKLCKDCNLYENMTEPYDYD